MSPDAYRKLILGGAIVVLGSWYGVSDLLSGARPAQATAATGEALDAVQTLRAGASFAALPEAVERELKELKPLPWPTDPFFRGASHTLAKHDVIAPGAGENRTVLNGIIRGDPPLAMINGTIVAVGDRLADGSVVTAVNGLSVCLDGPNGPRILELEE